MPNGVRAFGSMRPKLLDLFCCQGGASAGYVAAGFDVVGVDIDPQPGYPYSFVQADALEYVKEHSHEFNFIHASPPCQAKCTLTKGTNAHLASRYVDLYEPVKDLMYASGKPGVIENPESRPDWTLCGEMFGLGVIRHRKFELVNWSRPAPAHKRHRGRVRGWRHGVYYDGPYVAAYGAGGGKASISEMQEAMGIAWVMDRRGLTEAIPPAYTEYVGSQFLNQ